MKHGIAFIIVVVLAILLLVPLVWWMVNGFSFFQTFDVVTKNKVSTSTPNGYTDDIHMTPENNPIAPVRMTR